MKHCTQCGAKKVLDQFALRKDRGSGARHSWCQECRRKSSQERYSRDYGTRPSDYPMRTQEENRRRNLMRMHGISVEEWQAMLMSQDGLCAICGQPPRGKKDRWGNPPRLHVDHDHDSGGVRALLCNTCNQGLGLFGDSVELLTKAAAYLLEHSDSEVNA